ncbi:MAG: ATPase, T2SS/T4P/T4SS family, partial [Acidobacteria bacterium]|nr:ATPase, T2SS/T4P/T4SS family [Acidobacteriota bacterium]MDW7984203.1 ATPase, T2SS/T4P/T4SS family [Acidobacteriota bacterium]
MWEGIRTETDEWAEARRWADRYGLPLVDLASMPVQADLFRAIPAELMLAYRFVPYRRSGDVLEIAICDPSLVMRADELEWRLGTKVRFVFTTPSAIETLLKRSESSQRVLEEATQTFRAQVVHEDEEEAEEVLTIDRLTTDTSPVVRLVDSIIFNALQRRASDIHIETQDRAVVVKYRIDGVLQYAMEPIDKRYHTAIISRVKVMAELDI